MDIARGRSAGSLIHTISAPEGALAARAAALHQVVDRTSVTLLRYSVGVVFVWFGALKLLGATPAAELIARTVPILPASFLVPALGAFEVLVGIALLIGKRLHLIAVVLVMHLAGTFLVLVMAPGMAFEHGNPLMLTMTGEFVVKNFVLIAAGLVIATKGQVRSNRLGAATQE